MERNKDISGQLAETVREAAAHNTALAIVGGGTKTFYGLPSAGQQLDVGGHCGIVSYEPTELVITARAGTPLADIETALAEKNQMLGFEPPHFDTAAAAGQSKRNSFGDASKGAHFTQLHAGGSAPASEWPPSPEAIGAFGGGGQATQRGWSRVGRLKELRLEGVPSPRESGATLGRRHRLRSLGSAPSLGRERARLRVGHKNPERQGRNSALRRTGNEKRRRFRCLAPDGRGAWHLGVLLEISLKILPRPEQELTLAFELPVDQAIATMNQWSNQPLPLSAACHMGNTLYVRMSGAGTALQAARARLGGEVIEKGEALWHNLREQRHPFFDGATPLWRLSVPPATPPMDVPGQWLVDWGGAQRWLKSDAAAGDIRRAVEAAGGHATLFRGGDRQGEVFHPLPPALHALHRRLKQAFDPRRILNPGRLYSDL